MNLRIASQQLRDNLEKLRIYAAEVDGNLPQPRRLRPATATEPSSLSLRTPLDVASTMQERVQKARHQAQALRRRAADLRNQAAEFRARSENLRGNLAAI